MQLSIFCRADRLRLATLFQSTEETRYYLNGVYVHPQGAAGVNIAATDGHTLVVFRDDAGIADAGYIINLPKNARAAVKGRKTREFCWFGLLNGGTGRRQAAIVDTSLCPDGLDGARELIGNPAHTAVIWTGGVDIIDGTFPDYARVVPRQAADAAPGAFFNSTYIRRFGEIAIDAGAKSGALRIFANGNEPALVDCGRTDCVGVLMPIRADVSAYDKQGALYRVSNWISESLTRDTTMNETIAA